LARGFARLRVGLGEFLSDIGIVVFDAVTVICVVLPLVEIINVVAIEIVDVHVPVGHVDVTSAPVAVAPDGVPYGDTRSEHDARGECTAARF
jgi:hypothetical protein